ncbi:ATP-binding cassette domain-containing protein [Psychrobacillus sp. OK032]|uniref:ATP-binding cassette domain-containing protein n=1 Tax=Psychrobacillus sp. OK032 TaxID=1884358 RepID=UPI0008C20CA5|nr:ATP-binding cassette domain-containing protein [Psychrobacillus sp. OK032]SES30250.1 ABC-type multidrug transport system, ATPase component [Psychrobacillus sp. OK032]
MGKIILEASNLKKEIDGNAILQHASFKIEENISIAIRGSNGSGKSTLLKLLAGIYEPTSGKIIRNANRTGYVPEHFPENLRFKLKEYLTLVASFQGIPEMDMETELSEYISLFGIEPYINTPLKKCSKGTKQKVGILQALLIKPDLLLLDEPLTGLDTNSQQNLMAILEKLKTKMSIIFTTHEDLLVDNIANQVLYVKDGCVLVHTKPKSSYRVIKVRFPNKDFLTELKLDEIHIEEDKALITVPIDKSDYLLKELLNRNCSVLDVRERI